MQSDYLAIQSVSHSDSLHRWYFSEYRRWWVIQQLAIMKHKDNEYIVYKSDKAE